MKGYVQAEPMNRGYIKLWRKIEDSAVFQNEGLLKVFIWCLLRANHKETFVQVRTGRGFSEVKLLPGTFLFGRGSAAKKLHMSPSTVWKRILKLEKLDFLNSESNSHYSIIQIINWHIYQATQEESNSEGDRQVTGKEHRQELKNDKKYKYTDDFLKFYAAYPNKKDKLEAFKAWQKLNGTRPPLNDLLTAIQNQIEWRNNANGDFRPEWKHPATWLNKGSWADEVIQEKKSSW